MQIMNIYELQEQQFLVFRVSADVCVCSGSVGIFTQRFFSAAAAAAK